jgi:hypothetical protein
MSAPVLACGGKTKAKANKNKTMLRASKKANFTFSSRGIFANHSRLPQYAAAEMLGIRIA